MDHPQHGPVLRELPIERIFRKVTGRKMTEPERLCFHLKPESRIEKRIKIKNFSGQE